jgi:hypothetical protein
MEEGALTSSYRDPAGFVFMHGGNTYRQINKRAEADFTHLHTSGLYEALIKEGLLVSHTEVALKNLPADPERFKVIRPAPIPFISYPYEWSYGQLKDAALLTLRVQELALKHNMILKDASAYNVQFVGKRPIFIDTLSFAIHTEGEGWEGYKQFCEQFLAPLAIAHFTQELSLQMLQTYLEGVPLSFAVQLLPKRARFQKGLLPHLYLHARAQARAQGSGTEAARVSRRKVSMFALNGLMASLNAAVKALRPPKTKTEWGEYYDFTNYSDKAFKDKARLVEGYLKDIKTPLKMVWDIGANNGAFSELAAKQGAYTIAWDIDPKAVMANYQNQTDTEVSAHMLPLVGDIARPSPAIGWALDERSSLFQRGPADVVLALALIHHLAIGRNVPLDKIATMLQKLGKHIIIEFVPKEDSKVQHLLSSRTDIFPHYTPEDFEAAMAAHFKLIKKTKINHSERTLYLYSSR